MNREQRLRVIADEYTQWERELERKVTPDPDYAGNERSQYPEGIVAVSATPAQDAELIRRLREAGAVS